MLLLRLVLRLHLLCIAYASLIKRPTSSPTASWQPTFTVTSKPTGEPSEKPTDFPTITVTAVPTDEPTEKPTSFPTTTVTAAPTNQPSGKPTHAPTFNPTPKPTNHPTSIPSKVPTSIPTFCPDPLQCYLESLSFTIPIANCVTVNKKDLCFSDITCHGIDISAITSSYVIPATVDMEFDGIGTTCVGTYKYGKVGVISGDFSVKINETNVHVALYTEKYGQVPVLVTFSECEIPSLLITITLNDADLNQLSNPLSIAIKEGLNVALCVVVPRYLEGNVTNTLNNVIDPTLIALANSPPSPIPDYGKDYVNWHESIISKVEGIISSTSIDVSNIKEFAACIQDGVLFPQVANLMKKEFQNMFDVNHALQMSSISLLEINKLLASLIYVNQLPAISVANVNISGFNTISELLILSPTVGSNFTLSTAAAFDFINVDIKLLVSLPVTDTEFYTEELTFKIHLSDLSFDLELLVAVDEHLLHNLYIDQLTDVSCWLYGLVDLSIPSLKTVLSINQVSITEIGGDAGPLNSGITDIIDSFLQLLTSSTGYGDLLVDVIGGILQGPVRSSLNDKIRSSLAAAKDDHPCLSHYPYPSDKHDYVAWTNSTLVTSISHLVNDKLGYEGVNKIVNCATDGTGEVTITANKQIIEIKGLNSFYDLKIVKPFEDNTKPYALQNAVGLGYCESDRCTPFEIAVTTENSMDKLQQLFLPTPSINVNFLSHNLHINLDLLMQVDLNAIKNLQYKQIGVKGCMGSTFSAFDIETLALSLTDAELVTKSGSNKNITKEVKSLFKFLSSSRVLSRINDNFAMKLSQASDVCENGGVQPDSNDDIIPVSDSGSNSNKDWEWELAVLVGCSVASLCGLLWAYQHWGKDSRLSCLRNIFQGKLPQTNLTEAELLLIDNRSFWEKWNCPNALIFQEKVPLWFRILLPLSILGNIAMFISSNLAADAVSVMVKLTIGSHTINVGSIFDFGLASTVSDMWSAKVYALSILIAFFSGAWPYVKLFTMLVAWCSPPGILSIKRREFILKALDALGKWSLIDFFVMILFLCAFYFQLTLTAPGQPTMQVIVDVTVQPNWGFYSFLLATMMSLGIGHILLACHRLIVDPQILPVADEFATKESLSSFEYHIVLNEEILKSDHDISALNSVRNSRDLSQGSYLSSSQSSQQRRRRRNTHNQNSSNPNSVHSNNNDNDNSEYLQLLLGTDGNEGTDSTFINHEDISNLLHDEESKSQLNGSNRIDDNSIIFRNNISISQSNQAQRDEIMNPILIVKLTNLGLFAILSILALSMFVLFEGVFLYTIQFEFKGLTGLLLKDNADVDYSFYTIGMFIPAASGHPNQFAVRWLQAAFFLFGVGMPVALLVTLAALWTIPLKLTHQRLLFILCEIFNAWSTLDVFCIAIAASLLEIQQFAMFIVGDSCDGINAILAQYMDPYLDGDDTCFDVIAQLKQDSWVLFIASLLLLIVALPTLEICDSAIKQRLLVRQGGNLVEQLLSMKSLKKSLSNNNNNNNNDNNNESFNSDMIQPLINESNMNFRISGSNKILTNVTPAVHQKINNHNVESYYRRFVIATVKLFAKCRFVELNLELHAYPQPPSAPVLQDVNSQMMPSQVSERLDRYYGDRINNHNINMTGEDDFANEEQVLVTSGSEFGRSTSTIPVEDVI
eukprot:gene4475-6326_t